MTEPVVTVHGDKKHGFIVELYDGDRHETFAFAADSKEAAAAEALKMFAGEQKGKQKADDAPRAKGR